MVIKAFPPVDTADEEGFLAVGGDLELESLLLAYSTGIFPWPHYGHLVWFSPPKRAILKFNNYHQARSLKKLLRKNLFEFRHNQNFSRVIEQCASPENKGREDGTWITTEMKSAYINLYQQGYAESFEIYENNALVGGLYGVKIKNFFAAESMFHKVPNASKLALDFCIKHLLERGITWFDCQIMSPHLKAIGAELVSREAYLKMLSSALK